MRRLISDRGLAAVIAMFCVLLAGSMALSALALRAGQKRDDRLARQGDTARAQANQLARQANTIRTQAARIKRLAEDSNHALCALRRGLEGQVKQTDVFLREHPEGFAGVSAATLRLNEKRQRGTIRALSNLRCG